MRSHLAVLAAASVTFALAGAGPAAADWFPNQARTGPELRDRR
ncbi:hypothetical protein ACFCZ1_04330 [Streptomyces sp. NPDC056224]